ncbi:MAG: carbon storage regulator [Pirellulaceae bacterium]|nr:carbon storage regulator [Pirellulaceae bacterium]
MLVLSRKKDEQIIVGDNVKIKILQIRGNTVRIGIEAPGEISVMRGELVQEIETLETDSNCTIEFRNNDSGAIPISPRLRVVAQKEATDTPSKSHDLGTHRLQKLIEKMTGQNQV